MRRATSAVAADVTASTPGAAIIGCRQSWIAVVPGPDRQLPHLRGV